METSASASGRTAPGLQPNDHILDTILDTCLALVLGATRCRSIGIRVEEEGDFPIVRSLGFSDKFIKQERSLLPPGAKTGQSAEERLSSLECLCGRVIRGERAGCEELFSAKGCLWLNDFCDTDKIPPDVHAKMRKACLEARCQSFALVPCRPNSRTLGLLHICDTRRGLISGRLVASLEKTGEHLAKLVFQIRQLKAGPPGLPAAEAGHRRVLVVDDEREITELVRRMLETKGYSVATAFSGQDALELMSQERFDLVITDFNMPGMSGLELAGEIRRHWQPYAPPIILMTGSSSEGFFLDEKPPPDVVAFLWKPFSGETLLEAIQAVVH